MLSEPEENAQFLGGYCGFQEQNRSKVKDNISNRVLTASLKNILRYYDIQEALQLLINYLYYYDN